MVGLDSKSEVAGKSGYESCKQSGLIAVELKAEIYPDLSLRHNAKSVEFPKSQIKPCGERLTPTITWAPPSGYPS